jgi:hypothetical protein
MRLPVADRARRSAAGIVFQVDDASAVTQLTLYTVADDGVSQ